jgi:hypothetical protein
VLYMVPQVSSKLFAARYDPRWWGIITTPAHYNLVPAAPYFWIADNQVFTGRFDWGRYLRWLQGLVAVKDRCVGVAVPDVLYQAGATLAQFERYAGPIRELGLPVAYVAQDGSESLPLPEAFDTLFIGGSIEWKLGPGADAVIARARAREAWVHVGRVNSQKRIRHFQRRGCHSVDGTTIAYSPDKMIKRLEKVLRQEAITI